MGQKLTFLLVGALLAAVATVRTRRTSQVQSIHKYREG
jgi:hypothetical protein